MTKLHLFNPDNDIALASGVSNFTPPKAAAAMRAAGAALPLWYGDAGDRLLAYGINDAWLESVERHFDPGVKLWDHSSQHSLEPTPWGWSAAAKHAFVCEGFDSESLPSDGLIDQWRELSHRRTAAALRDDIAPRLDFEIAPAAVEISDIDTLDTYLKTHEESIIKSPWSSSGRGLIDTRRLGAAEVRRRCEGTIRRQGSVMVEEAYTRAADFALLYECGGGRCRLTGYSLFDTDAGGNYTGNILAPDMRLLERLDTFYPAARIISAGEALREAIETRIAPAYDGPLGVDMLVARKPDGSMLLDATVELNLRLTMGFVAHSITSRYLAEGSEGRYRVMPADKNPVSDTMTAEDRKMISGRINLTPPGGLFRFVVEADIL